MKPYIKYEIFVFKKISGVDIQIIKQNFSKVEEIEKNMKNQIEIEMKREVYICGIKMTPRRFSGTERNLNFTKKKQNKKMLRSSSG